MATNNKILIVEDDDFLRGLIVKKLEKANYQAVVAVDGEEALPVAAQEKPCLILLDLMLPKKDGFEVLSDLKAREDLKNIPVVILTNLGQENDFEKGKRLGADDYFIKAQVNLDEIVDKVAKLCPIG